MRIPSHLQPALDDATEVSINFHDQVTLHKAGNKMCNVARLNGGQVIHHPDPSGDPRPDSWKQALERTLFKRCSCGKWNLREDSFCLCKQPL